MRLRAIWITLATTAACNATPIPQPPPDENLDVGKIVFPETQPTTTQVGFFGEPGAAPPNSTLRITNLDSMDAPVAVVVDAEGAFEATISAEFNDEIRFLVLDGDERLSPIDLLYTGTFETPVRVDCFTVDLELNFHTTSTEQNATLGFSNGCASDAAITGTSFRTNDPDFAFVGTPSETIFPGVAEGVSMLFTPTAIGEIEDVLFVNVQVDGVNARHPVTLFGVGE